jgi:O-antigen/teichoic acid export membrane protein
MTEISRKRLTSDSFFSVTAAVLYSLFGAAYLIVIGNYWGSSGLGIFSLCISLYLIASLLFNVGIHNAVLYEVAAAGQDRRRASAFVYTALSVSIIAGCLGGLISFLLAPIIAAGFRQQLMTNMVRIFAVALPFFVINKTALGILNAHRRMRLIAAVNVIRGGLTLAYLISSALSGADLVTIAFGFVIAELTILVLLFTACYKTHKFTPPSLHHAKRLISFGWKMVLTGVIGDVNARLDILVIGIFWDASVVGIYTVASVVAKGLWLMPSAVQRVTNPLIVQLYSSHETEKLHRTMDVLIRLGTALFAVLGVAVISFIRPLIGLLYPAQSDMFGAVIPLYFLLPGTVMYCGIVLLGTAPSTSIGRPENALKIAASVFGVNILMNFALVPLFAAEGAAAATTLSLVVALLYFSYLCKKYLDFVVPLAKFGSLFLVFCVVIVSTEALEGLISRFIVFAAGLLVVVGVLVAIGMIRKPDWNLICSITKSFATLDK